MILDFLSQHFLSESLIRLIFGERNERFAHIAHFLRATWANRSRSLIWFERNERMSDERMSEFPALPISYNQLYLLLIWFRQLVWIRWDQNKRYRYRYHLPVSTFNHWWTWTWYSAWKACSQWWVWTWFLAWMACCPPRLVGRGGAGPGYGSLAPRLLPQTPGKKKQQLAPVRIHRDLINFSGSGSVSR